MKAFTCLNSHIDLHTYMCIIVETQKKAKRHFPPEFWLVQFTFSRTNFEFEEFLLPVLHEGFRAA